MAYNRQVNLDREQLDRIGWERKDTLTSYKMGKGECWYVYSGGLDVGIKYRCAGRSRVR